MCRRFLVEEDLYLFKDPATTVIYTLSLHDALPISFSFVESMIVVNENLLSTNISIKTIFQLRGNFLVDSGFSEYRMRSEEHTSELQSQFHLVCRLLLEKKNHQHELEVRS